MRNLSISLVRRYRVFAVETGAALLVEWTDASADEDGFRIELSTDSFTTIAKTVYAAANAESVTITGLLYNQEYDARCYAYNEAGDSAQATTTPVTTLPDVCLNPTAVQNDPGNADIDVDCDVPVGPNSGAASYKWEYKKSADSSWTTWGGGATTKSQTITGLDGETSYDFRVSGNTAGGTGNPSNTVTVTTGVAGVVHDFVETFETDEFDNAGWVTGSGADGNYATAPAPLVGTKSLGVLNTWATTTSPSVNASEVWIYFRVVFTAIAATGNISIVYLEDSGGNVLGALRTNGSGLVQLFGTSQGAAVSLTAGVEYHMWLRYKAGTGSNAILQWWHSTDGVKPALVSSETLDGVVTANFDHLDIRAANGSSMAVYDSLIVHTSEIGDNPL